METSSQSTLTPRTPLYLLGFCVLIAILYIAADIIIPLVFAGLFSIMLISVVNRLVNKGYNRALAVALTEIPALLVLLAIIIVFFSQFSNFADAFPKFLEKFKTLFGQLGNWAASTFNIKPSGLQSWLASSEKDLLNKSGAVIGYTISTMSNTVVNIFLVPVYIFMMLYYQPIIVGFLRQVFGKEHTEKVDEILPITKDIIKSYLVGLLIETAIVTTLNSIGLLILGIDYALLLGIMGGLLNVIPYLGAIIAVSLYMIVALVTKSQPTYVFLVFLNYVIIQFIDNNFLVPKIIGSKVKLNAFVSIVAVVAGGALWGIPGMFLSIPLIAVLKVIFDRVDPLQPWGFLLGDSMPESQSALKYFKRLKKRKAINGTK